MLRSLGSVFCVVVMAAFVFGCGGGGTAQMMEQPPVDQMPPPDEPTDAEQIAEARQAITTILSNARTRAQGASLAASAIRTNDDATADQRARAGNRNTAAQAALALIENANSAAIAATTPAAAQTALANARTAQSTLNTAASALSSIQSAVQAVANARRQREMDERALTNNSSLIQHVRDNKLLSDALLGALTAGNSPTTGSIRVGSIGATTIAEDKTETCPAPCAIFPGNTGTGATRVTGQRTVEVQNLISDSKTPALRGTGRLPHGFDLKNANNTTFVNAYTDISKTRLNVRTRTNVVINDPDTAGDERYTNMDFEDTDYLLAGIWVTVDNDTLGNSRITAFAYGSQPIAATQNFCVGIENSALTTTTSGSTTTNTTRTCGPTTGLNSISRFVDDGKDFTATYTGNANGAYVAGSDSSYFTGDVRLTAEFKNPTGAATEGSGSIQGAVTNISAGGQPMAGSIELQKQDLTDNIGAAFAAGEAVGVVDDKSFSGAWKGQFFGYRYSGSTMKESDTMRDTNADPVTTTITRTEMRTYKPQAPGSVAGTFYATQESNPAGSAAFIGAFGANRP